jgi:iron complex outermembrane recepter protein
MQKNQSFRANALRTSVSLALAAGLSTTGYGVAFAQDGADTEGRVQVTGSRLKRADLEGALPVTVIDREQIQLSGEISVADLLRNTSFNSFGSFRPQSGSSAQSFAGLSLRGLGSGRTLILIDGRRAPIAPNIGSAQDLNSLPLAAIERIEILSDGASAIYGTDAIGGVVNIITRRDFNGVEMSYGASAPTRPGGDTEEGSVIFGASSDRARVLAGASFNNRHIIWQRDRFWSSGGASVFSSNFLAIPGFFLTHPDHGSANVPGCQDPSFTVVGSGATTQCLYDFTAVAADEADVRNQSLFARADFQINDDWSTYMNAGVSRVKSFGRYAPVPSSPWPGTGFPQLTQGTPNHPATDPADGGLNPNWMDYQDPQNPVLCSDDEEFTNSDGDPQACTEDEVLYYRYDPTGAGGLDPALSPGGDLFFIHRFAALGPRDTSTDAQIYDLQLGFQGRIGTVDLDFGVRQTESKYYDLGRNYVVGGLAQQVIDSGDYNIYDPTGNDQTIMNSMIATINREATTLQREAYAIANMDLFEMTGGMSGLAFGMEYRDEQYADIYDTLQSSNQIVGSAGNSAFGGRDVTAAFFEVLFPVTSDFEISAAGRYDRYSDFGSNFSPKVAFRWQPMDNVTVRGSWGQGFAAPTLDIVSAQPAFGAAGTTHGPTCDAIGGGAPCATQVTTFSIANPNMGPEESTQYSLGLAWDVIEWFNFSIDYYNIEVENRVAFIGVNTIAQCIRPGDWTAPTQNCPPGMTDWTADGSIIRASVPDPTLGIGIKFDETTGQILFAQTGFSNLGFIETDGFDFNGRFNFDLGEWGRLAHMLQLGYVRNYSVDGGPNNIDGRGFPKYRGTLMNRWSMGDFETVWNINYIHSQPDPGLRSHTTHDLQVNYHTPWNGRFTLGVRNVMNKDPVADPAEARGINMALYEGYGRVPYFRYRQSF